jgi:hypothetical protein
MHTLALLAVLLFSAPPAQADTASLTGKWTGTMTRTAPDGQTQTIEFMFELTQKGKVLTGTVGPDAQRQWAIEKGAVEGTKISFQVQQPNGPMRTFTLTRVKDRLQGEMLAQMGEQSFTAKVDAARAKDAKDK